MLSPLPSVSVHGFNRKTYTLVEGEQLNITFDLEVKGQTIFPSLDVGGRVTSEADTAGEYIIIHNITVPLLCILLVEKTIRYHTCTVMLHAFQYILHPCSYYKEWKCWLGFWCAFHSLLTLPHFCLEKCFITLSVH